MQNTKLLTELTGLEKATACVLRGIWRCWQWGNSDSDYTVITCAATLRLGRRLRCAPPSAEVRYSLSGSEAVEIACKDVRMNTGKQYVVPRQQGRAPSRAVSQIQIQIGLEHYGIRQA